MRKSLSVPLALLLVGGFLGCGSGPTLVKVTGTVTHNGKPVANALIHFRPEKGKESVGFSDDQGQYTLRYDKAREGAVPGTHRVFVQFKPKTPKDEDLMARGEYKFTADQQAILQKYGKAEDTPLRIEVSQENNQDIPLKLD